MRLSNKKKLKYVILLHKISQYNIVLTFSHPQCIVYSIFVLVIVFVIMIRSPTQENEPYLLREVRLRILASVTTGNCRSGVRDLCGEGLRVAVCEKGWVGSSKELLLAPASSLAGSESAGLAGDAEGAVDVIQSGLIWCWCA